jgi:hypothetical protein
MSASQLITALEQGVALEIGDYGFFETLMTEFRLGKKSGECYLVIRELKKDKKPEWLQDLLFSVKRNIFGLKLKIFGLNPKPGLPKKPKNAMQIVLDPRELLIAIERIYPMCFTAKEIKKIVAEGEKRNNDDAKRSAIWREGVRYG